MAQPIGPTTAGTAGVVGGLVWLAALVIEYAFDLFPPGSGALYTVDQLLFGVAMVGFIVAVLGVRQTGAAGEGRAGRMAITGWAAGWLLVLLGLLLALVTSSAEWTEVFPAIGGLLTAIANLVAGILIARAGVWSGWPRWTPLGMALYVIGALFVPLALGAEPTFLTEAGWAVGYSILGLALVRSGSAAPRDA